MENINLIEYLKRLPSYKGQITHIEVIPPKAPRLQSGFGETEEPLNPAIRSVLTQSGLLPLYSHQAEAINAIRKKNNVVVSTGFASGKTLCYNIPVIESLLSDRYARAIYLYPTKALAQDQMRSLKQLLRLLNADFHAAIFDGDTPDEERKSVRSSARLIMTNPDMLHYGILPNHRLWSKLFQHLKFVIIDEAHIYRGIFGGQVGQVLRRLRRICDFYGSKPQFIAGSATIANPGEHLETLTGLPFSVISDNGSPQAGRDFLFWNPPFIDNAGSARRSANREATIIFAELIKNGIRTLVFTRTRRLTELIYRYTRDILSKTSQSDLIKPYRAGYLAEDRRLIEKGLFEGKLLGAVATTALELGIDIGDLKATVLTGYPGSISSTWQQAGRSGRRVERGLSILIGLDNPLDQFLMNNPQYFFQSNFEKALSNPSNINILKQHILCAAREHPISSNDIKYFGDDIWKALNELQSAGFVKKKGDRWYLSSSITYPAEKVNIRSISESSFSIIDSANENRVLETVEDSIAFSQIHPGAIYLHQGNSYLITQLDLLGKVAIAKPVEEPYYTQAKDLSELSIIKEHSRKKVLNSTVYFGDVEVYKLVIGFKKKQQYTDEVVGEEILDLPPKIFNTQALWFDIEDWIVDRLKKEQLDMAGGLHAIEHCAIGLLPMFALCDRNDIGGLSSAVFHQTGKPQIFIYDAYPGGIGLAQNGYEIIDKLWDITFKVIRGCPCEDGCPSCIQSPKCGNNNEPLDKQAALFILKQLLGIM